MLSIIIGAEVKNYASISYADMIFFRVSGYLKYILFSGHRRGHRIHSPFVFDLVSRIFRNKIDDDIVFNIEKLRARLISDKRLISVRDLGTGAGSSIVNLRKVSEIAKYSSIPKKYGVLLSNLAAEFGKPLIVEFGTSFGISTMYMAVSCSDTMIYTMEGCPAKVEIATGNFKKAGLNNIKTFTGPFEESMPAIIKQGNKPGLVFIDGNHRKEPVLKYFKQMAEISDSKTVIVIDDINYSVEMRDAWEEIKGFEEVSVTIDIFRMGIVFFREGISQRDYVIRY